MNLIPWRNKRREDEPVDLVERGPAGRLPGDMDRWIDQFFRDPWSALEQGWISGLPAAPWSPTVDISETDKEITVRAEIPGVDPKDLDVTVSGNMLTLTGEKKHEHEEKGRNFYRSERSFGSFRRSIVLPADTDADDVKAESSNGVVTITLKKAHTASPKRVPIKVR